MLESIVFLRKKYKLWPSTSKYHSLENAHPDEIEPDNNQVPILGCLQTLGEWHGGNDDLKKELMKLNRLFRLMEVVERRFKVAQVQISNDWTEPDDDPKV